MENQIVNQIINQIIDQVKNGNRQLYAKIIDEFKTPIFNLAYQMTGSRDEADDLAQDIFLKAFQSLHRFDTKRRFFPWLYTIALNIIRNHLRRQKLISLKHLLIREQEKIHTKLPNPESALSLKEDILQLSISLNKLPLTIREAVILKYYQDLSFEDVAEILKISLSGAKMRVYRGLEKLKKLMEK
jgi:RNA polymerase sigma-70 factor, ECF subfamily